ncbi:uncharacterized protein B0I36DRAFT_351387 [Microdochium trichocladiopsis]|uniref:Uncharacterized protein n=1 Tax=Microdochium trichocladiopsis TaxID=1682393 RepID=A0A9P9BS39_9PEZI|nr:uncharacterized protein B0I36DRAFT_351387 [Microdochium trichocladiopsis]KAH7027925.1 hypothetical protein B0I36DRAFT_351387 [Microdochium trichocladiopsis]
MSYFGGSPCVVCGFLFLHVVTAVARRPTTEYSAAPRQIYLITDVALRSWQVGAVKVIILHSNHWGRLVGKRLLVHGYPVFAWSPIFADGHGSSADASNYIRSLSHRLPAASVLVGES